MNDLKVVGLILLATIIVALACGTASSPIEIEKVDEKLVALEKRIASLEERTKYFYVFEGNAGKADRAIVIPQDVRFAWGTFNFNKDQPGKLLAKDVNKYASQIVVQDNDRWNFVTDRAFRITSPGAIQHNDDNEQVLTSPRKE